MPLFKCSRCGSLENSALTMGSWSNPPDKMLCSFCTTGKWHGMFPRQTPEEAGYEPENDDERQFYKLKAEDR